MIRGKGSIVEDHSRDMAKNSSTQNLYAQERPQPCLDAVIMFSRPKEKKTKAKHLQLLHKTYAPDHLPTLFLFSGHPPAPQCFSRFEGPKSAGPSTWPLLNLMQPIQIPLQCLPSLQQINTPAQLGVVFKLTESALDPLIQIISRDIELDQCQYKALPTKGPPPKSLSLSRGLPSPGHTSHRGSHCSCQIGMILPLGKDYLAYEIYPVARPNSKKVIWSGL
ncbi:hypothetical protein BTVI_87246 [Pitangus sulphuratus]|nr:hypothetical protein BTVI_87246 [Pitangus sulphuratus]